jgi:hypothetical protein
MGRRARAMVEQLSDVIVSTNQQCMSQAIGRFGLAIDGAHNVTITGLRISTTVAGGGTSNCVQDIKVDVAPLHDAIERRWDQVSTAREALRGRNTQLKVAVREALTVNVVQRCMAVAANSVKLRFANVQGDVDIRNLQVEQRARAYISRCLQNVGVAVGEHRQPLLKVLEDNEDALGTVEEVPGGDVEQEPPEIPWAQQPCQPALTVAEANAARDRTVLLSAAGAVGVVVVIMGLVVYHIASPPSRAGAAV